MNRGSEFGMLVVKISEHVMNLNVANLTSCETEGCSVMT